MSSTKVTIFQSVRGTGHQERYEEWDTYTLEIPKSTLMSHSSWMDKADITLTHVNEDTDEKNPDANTQTTEKYTISVGDLVRYIEKHGKKV